MAVLEVLSGAASGQQYRLEGRPQYLIGRQIHCDVVLVAKSVSREHARIAVRGDEYYLEDLRSSHGTLVNGRRLVEPQRLKDGDCIHFSDVLAVFRAEVPQASADEAYAAFEESRFVALEQAELATRTRLKSVIDITRALGSSLDTYVLLPKILEGLFEAVPEAERGEILLYDLQKQTLTPHAARSRRALDEGSDTVLPVGAPVLQRVMAERKSFVRQQSSLKEVDPESVLSHPEPSTIWVPLLGPTQQALGVLYLESRQGTDFPDQSIDILLGMAAIAGQALECAIAHQSMLELESARRQLQAARQLQSTLLPRRAPEIAGYRIAHYYEPAEVVGGDYLGYLQRPSGEWVFAIGDVVGKSLSAALFMAKLCAEIRFGVSSSTSLTEAMGRINAAVCDTEGGFVTLQVLVIDPRLATVTVASAGHMPPLLRRPGSAEVEELGEEIAGVPLGVDAEWQYQTATITLEPGALLLAYTDGISEARNAQHEIFGSKRLAEQFGAADADPAAIIRQVVASVNEFESGAKNDDACLLCLQRNPTGAP